MKLRGRGFSLIEVAIVVFLISLILMVVSRLAHETFVSLRFLEEKAQTVQSATLGLERLSSELREAVEVNSDTGNFLSFHKVDPQAPFALDYDRDSSPDVNPGDPSPDDLAESYLWSQTYRRDAFNRDHWGLVEYSSVDDRLVRMSQNQSNSLTSDVATNVNSFWVEVSPTLSGQRTGPSVFRISLSLLEKRRVATFVSVVVVPALLDKEAP